MSEAMRTTVSRADLQGLVRKSDLEGLVTKSDLKGLVTKSDMVEIQTRLTNLAWLMVTSVLFATGSIIGVVPLLM